MPICKTCGAGLAADKRFCTECGAPVIPVQIQTQVQTPAPTRVQVQAARAPEPVFVPVEEILEEIKSPPPPAEAKPGQSGNFAFSDPEAEPPSYSRYAVLSTGDYLLMMLLMLIPVVNAILLLFWSIGGSDKINRKHFARAALVIMLIGLAAGTVGYFLLGDTFYRLFEQITALF